MVPGPAAADAHHLARARGSNYLCSLGTNTVLGNVTNGLLALLLDGGAENWSLSPPGSPKVVSPDWPFAVLFES